MVACGVSFAATTRLATPDLSTAKPGDSVCMLSATVLLVEQLKQQLISAVENNDEALGVSACIKLERMNLKKDELEASRIGGTVNEIRRRVVETAPKISQKCRILIKQWRKQTETYTRAPSSCGGSNGVTPSMMSPAMRRLVTPQTPHKLHDGTSRSQVSSPLLTGINAKGQTASPRNGPTTGNGTLVAQAVAKVQREANTRESIGFTLNSSFSIGGKRKLDATSSVDSTAVKRSKSALISNNVASPQISISGVRQDTQSTAELLAQLSENLPQLLTPDLSLHSKSSSTSPSVSGGLKIKIPSQSRLVGTPSPATLDDRQKRKYTKRAPKFFKGDATVSFASSKSLTSKSEIADSILEKPKKEKVPAGLPSSIDLRPKDKKVDWYAALPSLKDLEARITDSGKASKNIRSSYIDTVNGNELVYMPFVDLGIPDVLEYGYPSDKCPKSDVPYPRSVRNALKSL